MSAVTRGGSQDGATAAAAPATAAAASSSSRKVKADDFVFGKMIGEGSFSSVFLARDATADVKPGAKPFREYAIKVCEKKKILQESKSEYIFREKDILATITKHFSPRVPFFVVLHSTFHDQERFFFAMTYARNGDLLKFIDQMAERDIDCVQFYAAELLAAVEFLHFKVGVIHRDLKPENILLNHKMHILITDFGSAKFIKDKYNITHITNTNNRTKNQRLITPENDSSEEEDEGDGSGVEAVTKAMETTNVTGNRRRRRVGGGADGGGDDDSDSDLPAQRGSKRRSFVGTAQYLSPEILTSRGSCRASDLWAIGCIIYQMITGLPPFQSDSDWVIFKKIEKLEYTFQDGFDKEAESLIRQLLVIDPDQRLGARNKKCYDTVKQHPFFHDVDFDALPDQSPPGLDEATAESTASEPVDPVWAKEPDAKPGVGRLPKLELESYYDSDEEEEEGGGNLLFPQGMQYVGPKRAVKMSDCQTSGSSGQQASGLQPTADAIRKRWTENHVLQSAALSQIDREILMSHQTSSNKFHRFVEGHLILREGILDKKKGLLARRRMFLLTEGEGKPHLYYVDPDRKVLKGQVPLTKDVRMEIKDFRIFFLHTPGRTYYLLCPNSTAQEWCQAVDDVIKRYFGKQQQDK